MQRAHTPRRESACPGLGWCLEEQRAGPRLEARPSAPGHSETEAGRQSEREGAGLSSLSSCVLSSPRRVDVMPDRSLPAMLGGKTMVILIHRWGD